MRVIYVENGMLDFFSKYFYSYIKIIINFLILFNSLHQQHQQNKSAPVSVNRSESYKERLSHKRNRSQRKTSDPNLTSRPK